MGSVLKKGNFAMAMYVVLGLVLYGTWSLSIYFNDHLSQAEVKRVRTVQEVSTPFDIQALYPVWVANTKKAVAEGGAQGIDDLFKKDEPKVAAVVAPPEPDYSVLLGQFMKVESAANNGAFINGKFYKVGELVPEYSYPSHGKQIVPVVSAVRGNVVTIAHGKKKTDFKI